MTMKNKTKKILIGTSITIASATALKVAHRITAKRLMKIALGREKPKAMRKKKEHLAGSKEITEILTLAKEASEKLKNSDCEQVEIISHDGIRLVGHWHSCENPKRVIVAMHGWRSSWSQDCGMIADFWHENDCCVLYAEQRAHDNSEGDYMGFGLLERFDCLNWAKWVNEKTEKKLPIYLGGLSMGATTVLMTAGLDLPKNVKGIAADCAFTSPKRLFVVPEADHAMSYFFDKSGYENTVKNFWRDYD